MRIVERRLSLPLPPDVIWNATPADAITEGQGQTAWASPVHDARGNTVTLPQPLDLTATYSAAYDAWNRLAFVWVDSNADGDHDAGETVIARYEYDGLSRRTKKHLSADTDDDFDTFQHFYYNASWQVLETRKTTGEDDAPDGAQPEHQYVWSARYIDAPVLRDENKDGDGDCIDGSDERLYYLTDANMNVTALVSTSGTVVERYRYDPYGQVEVLDADFSADADGKSDYANAILYCGYYFDNETGLCCVRYRFYVPPLGRWLQRDRIGYGDGMGLYEYVRSTPVRGVDSAGLLTPASPPTWSRDTSLVPGYDEMDSDDRRSSTTRCPVRCYAQCVETYYYCLQCAEVWTNGFLGSYGGPSNACPICLQTCLVNCYYLNRQRFPCCMSGCPERAVVDQALSKRQGHRDRVTKEDLADEVAEEVAQQVAEGVADVLNVETSPATEIAGGAEALGAATPLIAGQSSRADRLRSGSWKKDYLCQPENVYNYTIGRQARGDLVKAPSEIRARKPTLQW